MAPLSCKTPLPIDTHLSTITAAVRDSRRLVLVAEPGAGKTTRVDRKSTRLNSSHGYNSYAVFCLKKKNTPSTSSSAPIIPYSISLLTILTQWPAQLPPQCRKPYSAVPPSFLQTRGPGACPAPDAG